MARKTAAERDLIDTRIAMKPTRSRDRKVDDVLALIDAHGPLPREKLRELLHAFGHSEWSRGFTEGVDDANGVDDG